MSNDSNDFAPVTKMSPYAKAAPNKPANLVAFLSVISLSEGTFSEGDHGYNVLVGGTLFEGYADHPRIVVDLRDKDGNVKLRSTAAGRYQILARIFDAYKGPLGLRDFGHDAQDAIAIQMLKEVRALPLVLAGRVEAAVTAASSRWASFPGNSYGQPTQKMDVLTKAFVRFGGTLAN